MIFQLDESLVRFARAGKGNVEVLISVLELLAMAVREGNHLVFAEMKLASEILLIVGRNSGSASSLLLRLINQYPKVAGLAYGIKLRVLVGDFDKAATKTVEGVRVIEYPLGLVNSGLLQNL